MRTVLGISSVAQAHQPFCWAARRKIGCRGGGIANGKRAGTRTAHVYGNGSLLCTQPVENRLNPRLHLRGNDTQVVMDERICRLGIAGA